MFNPTPFLLEVIMTTTKLDLVNRVLDSVGERRVTVTTGALALIAEDCIQLALDEVATSANWQDLLQTTVASSWSNEVATLSTSEEYRVRGVMTKNTQTSQTYKTPATFQANELFDRRVLYSWTGANTDLVRWWTFSGTGTIKCNPYPADSAARATVFFEYYTIPTVPAGDSDTYSPPDRWMRLIELRASALFALKHQADDKLHTLYNREYMELKKKLLSNDVGFPSGGYTMYRGSRGRNA